MINQELIQIIVKTTLATIEQVSSDNKSDAHINESTLAEIQARLSALESIISDIERTQTVSDIDKNDSKPVKSGRGPKKGVPRGPYKKKSKSEIDNSNIEGDLIALAELKKKMEKKPVKDIKIKSNDDKVFNVNLNGTGKYAKKIARALNSKTFAGSLIIAEVKRKHPDVEKFTPVVLLREIRLAKGRMDHKRRQVGGIGIYAKEAHNL